MSSELTAAIETHRKSFGLDLNDEALANLERFYAVMIAHNPLLHLVGPCTPEEFAVRHVLESLTMLEHLPEGTGFADVGSGAGLPALPCLIVREDLHAFLIESKKKKADFLRIAIAECEIVGHAEVIAKQFSETPCPDVPYVSCRALDKFTQHLPKLLKWSGDRTMLLFGGPALADELLRRKLRFEEKLMPMSERRYLFVVRRTSGSGIN